MEMKYIPVMEVIDYVGATSIAYPITVELDELDDTYGDNPCERFEFESFDDFNKFLADLAGFYGADHMRALTARIV